MGDAIGQGQPALIPINGRRKKTIKDFYESHMRLIEECPQLSCAQIDRSIYDIVNQWANLEDHQDYRPLKPSTYAQSFGHLLTAEYAYSELSLRRFDEVSKYIDTVYDEEHRLYFNRIITPDISKKVPPVIVSDLVIVSNNGKHCIGRIKVVDEDCIKFDVETQTQKRRESSLLAAGNYEVRYALSGAWLRNLRISLHESSHLKYTLFESRVDRATEYSNRIKIDMNNRGHEHLNERFSNELNDQQKQAIKNILEAKCRPCPYILYGPPGTGKTRTLIETVVQIYHRSKKAHILVVASSNSCVDKLAADLKALNNISGSGIGNNTNNISKPSKLVQSMVRLTSISNLLRCHHVPKYYDDDIKYSANYRVVVTTHCMAGRLRPRQFDYVIVDEAGHASEPEVMQSLNRCKSDGCIVLAGDPKQLGPVVKFRDASRLGLGLSLLERLRLTVNIYKLKRGVFNARFITKLIHSYRCDPRILALCNEMFYQNELECSGRTPPSLMRMLKVENPNLFINVCWGKEDCEHNNSSRFNPDEVRVCLDKIIDLYKRGIRPNQIGVITPYILQKEKLVEALKLRLSSEFKLLNERFRITRSEAKNNTEVAGNAKLSRWRRKKNLDWLCKIDTVDGFQGNEREIILITLVRTPNEIGEPGNISFIDEKKRFNVSLSRAKWMNIIIGHKMVLLNSEKWSRFLRVSQQIESKLEIDNQITYRW